MTHQQQKSSAGPSVACDNKSAVTLSMLAPGDTAIIVAIHAEEALHQRLLALGFRNGKQITLIRKASFSGPLQVRIGTTDILLRRNEAQNITVCQP